MESAMTWTRTGTAGLCGLALAAVWAFHGLAIAPLDQREAAARRDAADLRERIEGARQKIKEVREIEEDTGRTRGELKRLQDELPAGSAMISAPALVKEHFERSGIAVSLVRLNTTQDEPNMPGYVRGFWSVALPIDEPGRTIAPLLLAVAELDQQHSFFRVLDFAIRPDPENPDGRIGVLNVAAVIQK
jgi:hypothetical protein